MKSSDRRKHARRPAGSLPPARSLFGAPLDGERVEAVRLFCLGVARPAGGSGRLVEVADARPNRAVGRLAANDLLLNFFDELSQQPEKQDMRYVLALLLVRRRVMRVEEEQRDESGHERLLLYCPRRKRSTKYPRWRSMRADRRDSASVGKVVGKVNASSHAELSAVNAHKPVMLAGQGGLGEWLHGVWGLATRRAGPAARRGPGTSDRRGEPQQLANPVDVQRLGYAQPDHGPVLRAHFAYQRPCFFRLRADTGFTGQEVDLGSNAQLFWFWVKRNEPPAVYYCRHDQFATSQARQMIPIEPNWLIEALGTMEIDPNLNHDGPYPAPDKSNRICIRTIFTTPEGPNKKITVH